MSGPIKTMITTAFRHNFIILAAPDAPAVKVLTRRLGVDPVTDDGCFVLRDDQETRSALNRCVKAGMIFAEKDAILPVGRILQFLR